MTTAAGAVPVGTKRDRASADRALAALADLRSGTHAVTVGGVPIRMSNVDKVMYPEVGFTKLDVARYYARISPVLLPHLRGRPLTLKRYPHGVDGEFFYQKRCPEHRPDWLRTSEPLGDHGVEYCLPEDVRGLLWAANLADLELHVLLARSDHVERPTVLAFDLDPGDGADVLDCATVALLIRDLLHELGVDSYPKTSGSKGLQVYVPLNTPGVSYDQTKPFARAVAELLERQHPELVVHDMKKALRRNKVLVDWSQNDSHKTTVCAYSLRAKARPTVSTPLAWDEVERAHERGDATSLVFEADDVLERVARLGDQFAPVLKQRQELPLLG